MRIRNLMPLESPIHENQSYGSYSKDRLISRPSIPVKNCTRSSTSTIPENVSITAYDGLHHTPPDHRLRHKWVIAYSDGKEERHRARMRRCWVASSAFLTYTYYSVEPLLRIEQAVRVHFVVFFSYAISTNRRDNLEEDVAHPLLKCTVYKSKSMKPKGCDLLVLSSWNVAVVQRRQLSDRAVGCLLVMFVLLFI